MNHLFEQFVGRPLIALVSSIEILCEQLETEQTIDGVLSRAIHTLSCPPDPKNDSEQREKLEQRVRPN